ncbi:MAG: hypothetical protein WA418_26105 [Bradyrhizobium sp.]
MALTSVREPHPEMLARASRPIQCRSVPGSRATCEASGCSRPLDAFEHITGHCSG